MNIKKFNLFNESIKYNNKNFITEMCVAMCLLNPEFLDNILDKGLKARYTENSRVFLSDLKNILLSKSRFNLGKFKDDKFIEDDQISKINEIFNSIDFDINRDWNLLNNSRIMARSISDKLLPETKLKSDDISNIYWNGPNKTDEYNEDIIIETTDGNQYSFFINKKLSTSRSSSFNTFMDELMGDNTDLLFKGDYLLLWDQLTREYIKLVYNNSNDIFKAHINKFIDINKVNEIGFFSYYQIKHSDPKFKYLGEHIKELDSNVLNFDNLMSLIWKNGDSIITDFSQVKKNWNSIKNNIMNSKIIENLLTKSIKVRFPNSVKKENNWKIAENGVKMKLMKTIVNKLNCLERPTYYISNNGIDFNVLPKRDFFRNNLDNMVIKFDYHVTNKEFNTEGDMPFRIKLFLDGEELLELLIIMGFSGKEMSGKMSCKYRFDIPHNFNYLVSKTKWIS